MDIWVILLMVGLLLIVVSLIQPKPQKYESKEMERLLDSFIDEIEEENEKLIQLVSRLKHNMDSKIEHLENKIAGLEQQLVTLNNGNRTQEEAVPVDFSDFLNLRERYKQIFQMNQEGYTSEEIAKLLGTVKGEVDLILQLAKQGGANVG